MPKLSGVDQSPPLAQALPFIVQPLHQCGPVAHKGLVGHLHLTVRSHIPFALFEQPGHQQPFYHPLYLPRVFARRQQIAHRHPAARHFQPRAGPHQPQQNASGSHLVLEKGKSIVEPVSGPGQGCVSAPYLAVDIPSDAVAPSLVP